ncbi:hypothetical protein CJ030_MR6G025954 [Morella rubra]|uniref:Polygalacturonase n=1 Tax=Morella rubra TaxID=262757 RepID=A0A6A1VD84_9ROSI|nr:hypothetical protein CJ030_MR6G025954 [Morella rubra]
MNAMLMQVVFAFVLVLGLLSPDLGSSTADANPNSFDVSNYGAVGDGSRDDSDAFLKAWNAACSKETDHPTVIVPGSKTFLVHPVFFKGPCKATSITFQVLGRIIAPASPQAWKGLDPSQWLAFKSVKGLEITGSGIINGQGSGWWTRHAGIILTCHELQTMKLCSCEETTLRDLHFLDSPQMHIAILGCNGVHVKNLTITAPELSPNTDGIHIQSSDNVTINDTVIGTGDDCVSIGDLTSNINVSYVRCGPGHGISIGSLGKEGNSVQVENIHVSKVDFKGTTNGARIKTWPTGRGYVKGVTFEHLYFNSVQNPIIIDQNYCLEDDVRGACAKTQTGVHISDVQFNNLFGTSATDVAITLNCSSSVACTGIFFKSIQLKSNKTGSTVTSTCSNAHGNIFGVVKPNPCIQI